MGSEMSYIDIDRKIGSFIKKIFFRKITFDNYITISQSMLSFFNGVSILLQKDLIYNMVLFMQEWMGI